MAISLMANITNLRESTLLINIDTLSSIRKDFADSIKGENNPAKRPEVRKKISQNNKMKTEEMKEWFKEHNPMKNKESREKISLATRGKCRPSMRGENNPSKRQETREKISKKLKGKSFSEEHLRNMMTSKSKLYRIQGPGGVIYDSASEAARKLGIHQSTINRWVKKNKNGFSRITSILQKACTESY